MNKTSNNFVCDSNLKQTNRGSKDTRMGVGGVHPRRASCDERPSGGAPTLSGARPARGSEVNARCRAPRPPRPPCPTSGCPQKRCHSPPLRHHPSTTMVTSHWTQPPSLAPIRRKQVPTRHTFPIKYHRQVY